MVTSDFRPEVEIRPLDWCWGNIHSQSDECVSVETAVCRQQSWLPIVTAHSVLL